MACDMVVCSVAKDAFAYLGIAHPGLPGMGTSDETGQVA